MGGASGRLANGSDTDLGLMAKLQKRINQLEAERRDLLRSGCFVEAAAAATVSEHDRNNNNKDYVAEKIER